MIKIYITEEVLHVIEFEHLYFLVSKAYNILVLSFLSILYSHIKSPHSYKNIPGILHTPTTIFMYTYVYMCGLCLFICVCLIENNDKNHTLQATKLTNYSTHGENHLLNKCLDFLFYSFWFLHISLIWYPSAASDRIHWKTKRRFILKLKLLGALKKPFNWKHDDKILIGKARTSKYRLFVSRFYVVR